jgi:hypothetical protein
VLPDENRKYAGAETVITRKIQFWSVCLLSFAAGGIHNPQTTRKQVQILSIYVHVDVPSKGV